MMPFSNFYIVGAQYFVPFFICVLTEEEVALVEAV